MNNDDLKRILNENNITPRQLLEALKKYYKEETEVKDAWLPSIRCTSTFRMTTEDCAYKTRKSMSAYVIDAINTENERVMGDVKI